MDHIWHSLEIISQLLIIIGGLNWGLIAVYDLDLVASLFGPKTVASRLACGLVGMGAMLSAQFLLLKLTEAQDSTVVESSESET